MEKSVSIDDRHEQQQQQQQKQQTLKCPRCDSSNTKFCYFNNYSLSQPRHFCKACKRYWTRGGTLRNVPVGGGCRKNKRLKIQPVTTTTTVHVDLNRNPNPNQNPIPNPNLDHFPSLRTSTNTTDHHLNPLFYGLLPQNPSGYSRFDARVPSGYEFSQPHVNDNKLGFSSTGPGPSVVANHSQNPSSFPSCYPSSVFVGSTFSSTSAPTMASLVASGQQRLMDWNNDSQGQKNDDQIEDPASLLWNTTDGGGGGGWFDPTSNNGSSVPSLI